MAGIAVIIFSSQIPDLLGLTVLSIIAIAVIRKLAPKAPGFLIVVIAGVVA
jgi:MFS superfamily sulfate permease-like transporter